MSLVEFLCTPGDKVYLRDVMAQRWFYLSDTNGKDIIQAVCGSDWTKPKGSKARISVNSFSVSISLYNIYILEIYISNSVALHQDKWLEVFKGFSEQHC